MIRRCRPALGTFVEVSILDDDAMPDAPAFDAAFAAIARVERRMSYHDAASDLSRINREAHRRPVAVDAWTFDVLVAARDLFRRSDGAFDCTVAPLLVARGVLPPTGVDVDPDATFDDVLLDDDARTVRHRVPLAIDLGGIAKGFAVDRAIDALAAHGVTSAVVDAGGDLRVLGTRPVPIHVAWRRCGARVRRHARRRRLRDVAGRKRRSRPATRAGGARRRADATRRRTIARVLGPRADLPRRRRADEGRGDDGVRRRRAARVVRRDPASALSRR